MLHTAADPRVATHRPVLMRSALSDRGEVHARELRAQPTIGVRAIDGQILAAGVSTPFLALSAHPNYYVLCSNTRETWSDTGVATVGTLGTLACRLFTPRNVGDNPATKFTLETQNTRGAPARLTLTQSESPDAPWLGALVLVPHDWKLSSESETLQSANHLRLQSAVARYTTSVEDLRATPERLETIITPLLGAATLYMEADARNTDAAYNTYRSAINALYDLQHDAETGTFLATHGHPWNTLVFATLAHMGRTLPEAMTQIERTLLRYLMSPPPTLRRRRGR